MNLARQIDVGGILPGQSMETPMRTGSRSIAVVAMLAGLVTGASAHKAAPAPGWTGPDALEPLVFLLGTWGAAGSGTPGAATGTATFARGLQDRVIIRTSFAEYPATPGNPASRHDDMMIIHATDRAGVRADYYDNEGHVIRYAVTIAGNGDAVFLSDVASGEPRYRLTYKLTPHGVLRGTFAVAPPGKPDAFEQYLAWESRRQ
jgi:hypothetical protein